VRYQIFYITLHYNILQCRHTFNYSLTADHNHW